MNGIAAPDAPARTMAEDRGDAAGSAEADRALLEQHGQRLIDLARASVLHGFEFGRPLPVDVFREPPALSSRSQRVRAAGVLLPLAQKPQEWAETHLVYGEDQPVYSL